MPAPLERGLVERSGVNLMLLDVVVEDREGKPVPGLTKDDFFVQLDGRSQPIYSLDDLCRIEDGKSRASPPAQREPSRRSPTAPVTFPVGPAAVREPMRFVIYLDFSQLATDGRAYAVAEARRWIREAMQTGEEAQIVAYATQSGLKRLTPFTRDKPTLLAALDATDEDTELLDPWPMALPLRRHCCATVCTLQDCEAYARQEYFHGRRALRALKRLLGQLESVRGRKSLLLLHQNGTQFPARLYPVREDRIPDQVALLDEVGAEATLARTAIYAGYAGDSLSPIAGLSVNLGANLADFTGGGYSRGGVDLARTTNAAGRGSNCVYRVGIQRPPGGKPGPYRVKVTAGDRAVPFRYRVQFLDEMDRWWRQARDALENPEDSTDVAVAAAVVPRSASEGGWDLSVQVSLDLGSLTLFPFAGGQRGDWEVGALLTRDEGRNNWEMLGVSRVLIEEEKSGRFVLHERTLSGLDAGTYRLGAFVRDRASNAFGAAETTVQLPRPGRAGISGPLLRQAERERVVSALPLLKENKAGPRRTRRIESGAVPGGRRPFTADGPLEAVTWICLRDQAVAPESLIRFVSKNGLPLFKLGPAEPQAAGLCHSITDRIETRQLQPGSYAYHLRWNAPKETDSREAQVNFRIAAPTAREPARDTNDPSGEPAPLE